MPQIHTKLEISPDIIQILSAGSGSIWSAAHDDGSGNRINTDAVLDAAGYSATLGFFSAAFQGIRKAFRNRGKTKDDLRAEKEAAGINRTGGALEEMLLEYLQAAQQGSVDAESLDELIGTLEEIRGYARTGKLTITDEKALSEICTAVTSFTAAMTGSPAAATAGDTFGRIRDQLIRQKEYMEKAHA